MKPEEVAQTLLPSLLKMAALSTLPVPTRLEMCVLGDGGFRGRDGGGRWVPLVYVGCNHRSVS